MRKTWKRALSFVLSATMVLTAGVVTPGVKSSAAVDKNKTYTATAAMQMNTDIAKGIGEWDFNATSEFKLGQEATFSWTSPSEDVVGALSGNVVCLDTDVPWQESGLYCKVRSVRFDDVEVPNTDYSKIVFDREDASHDTERIALQNQWGQNPPGLGVFAEDYEFPAFHKLEIDFIIDDKLISDTPAPKIQFAAELMNNGGIWGWEGEGSPATDDVVKINVNGYGDYTFTGTASKDFSSESEGAMWVSTDLAAMPTNYTVVGKDVKVNGKSYDWSKAKIYDDDGNIRLGIWNSWNLTEQGTPLGAVEGSAGDIVEFTFTVKENAASTSQPTPTPPQTVVNGLKKGATFTSGSLKYKVTKAATITGTTKTAGTVTVTGLAKKKATSINVKNTVAKGTASYKVTAVGAKAFQKASKLKKATLGTAIKTIPASAFNGCTKLTTVKATGAKKIAASAFKGCKVLKSVTFAKLSSVKKGAFKSCKKTIKVGGKKAVKKANVKKLKKCGYKKFK